MARRSSIAAWSSSGPACSVVRGVLFRYAANADRAPWQMRALLGNAWTSGFAERAQTDLRDVILRRAVTAAAPRGATAIVATAPLGCR